MVKKAKPKAALVRKKKSVKSTPRVAGKKASKRPGRGCSNCSKPGHNIRTCPTK